MRKLHSFSCLILVALCQLNVHDAAATHYRAGEISYRQIAGTEYEVTVVTYTDPTSKIETMKIPVDWDDGSITDIPRMEQYAFPDYPTLVRNTYVGRHKYAADGNYLISIRDLNRIKGLENIPNSDSYAFYICTLLTINPSGYNNSAILNSPPIDDGCYGETYYHSPGAFDPDGDSLAFALITPAQAKNHPIAVYTTPWASYYIHIHPTTGLITWETPVHPVVGSGLYNIAIQITEYRKGKKGPVVVGRVIRDMQIRIRNCPYKSPVVAPFPNACVDAGNTVSFTVSAAHPDSPRTIVLQQYGAPPAAVPNASTLVNDPVIPGSNARTATFSWKTTCNDIHSRPYPLVIKAVDNVGRSGFEYGTIKVVGPAPLRLKATQQKNGFLLQWARDTCRSAVQYRIFRRIDSSHWNPQQCETSVPAYTGFVQINTIGTTINPNDTTYYDDNGGEGLTPLTNYCYRVVAVFPPKRNNEVLFDAPSDGYASGEVCNVIVRSKPIITHVSVRNTDKSKGSTLVRWLRPDTLDIMQYPQPLKIILNRKEGSSGTFQAIDSFAYSSMQAITDTFIIDTLINTSASQYFYKLDFVSDAISARQFIDASPPASSVRAGIYSTDRTNILSWSYKVPWMNDTIAVYRKNNAGVFDLIGTAISIAGSFTDTGLVNGVNYCYHLVSMGAYSSSLYRLRLINYSQEICGKPLDTIRPCPPPLFVATPCVQEINDHAAFSNVLRWTPPAACAKDVLYYRIYFKQQKQDAYVLLATVDNTLFKYADERKELKRSVAGCYVITAVDTVGNESFFMYENCVDNCPRYDIPNVFTPGFDGKNDVLHPFPYRFVDRIDLQIFNRWGTAVYRTTDLDINWDGRAMESGEDCVDGVYFYVCDVFETYLEGVKKRTISGTIHILK